MSKKTIHKTIDINQPTIIDYIQANKQAFIDSFIKPYLQMISPVVESKIKDAISSYYKSYKPFLYQRQYSLYGVYKLDLIGGALIFDEQFLDGVHRVNDKYIYDKMFKEGYHGGAPHNGGMYWRWPSKPMNGINRYSMWYPYGEAPQTEAPFNIMKNDIHDYVNTDGVQILASLIAKEVKSLMKGV